MTRARVTAALGTLAAVGVVAGWLSWGIAPLTDAVRGVRDPADFIRDYVTARARLEGGRGAPPSGEEANDLGQRLGTPRVLLIGGPYYLHPPPALLPVMAVAWLSWHKAAVVWTVLSLAMLVWLARSLVGIAAPVRAPSGGVRRAPSARWTVLLVLVLALWPPTLHCIEKGQWSIAVAALIAAGYRALEDGRDTRAGVWLGIAAAVKATPAVLIVMLLARSRRAAVVMLGTAFGAALLSLAVNGFAPWGQFFVNGLHDAAVWATWLANTASLQGVLARLLTASYFTRPLVEAPLLSRALFVIVAVAALVAGVVTRPRGGDPVLAREDAEEERAEACWSAAWLVLPVLLNPLGWTHVVLMLLPAVVVAFREGDAPTRVGAAMVLAVLGIPRQRLMAWAGPMPVPPLHGLVLGLHAMAVIALYVLLLRATARAAAAGLRVPPSALG